ncbi:MAG: four helix bundle protein [Flavobacteriales bacterium]|nr:four helix bundle protein [Flavobacteriales bacterium]
MRNFRELLVWQKAMEIGVKTYQLTRSFPPEEKFGLVSQLNRAAVSISSNIAEGASRGTDKDFKRFLEIAIGSAFEMESQIILCEKLQMVDTIQSAELLKELNDIQRMLSVFIKKLSPSS